MTPEPAESTAPDVVNLNNVTVENVSAELVRANNATITTLNSQEIDLRQSFVSGINANRVDARDANIIAVEAEIANLIQGRTGYVRAGMATVSGLTGMVMADHVALDGARTVILASNRVGGQNIRTSVLLAGNVEGNVETLADTRTVLISAAAAGAVFGMFFLAGQFLFRHRK